MNKPIRYYNKIRFVGAIIAAVYILFHGRQFDLLYALVSPGFYIALVVSISIALTLAEIVHRVTIWLDARSSWRRNPVERSIMQFTLAILLPAIIELLIISAYFYTKNEDIRTNGFLLIDFPVILSFIVFLNIYYIIHYLLQTENVNVEKQNTGQLLNIQYDGSYLNLNTTKDILYFYRVGRKVKAYTISGIDYPINNSINYLENKYTSIGYCRINRGVVINMNVVLGYEAGVKRDTLKVLFKPHYLQFIKDPQSLQFQITKECINSFKSALNMDPFSSL